MSEFVIENHFYFEKNAHSVIRRFFSKFSRRTLACSTCLILVVSFIYGVLRCLNYFVSLVLIILRTEECEISRPFARALQKFQKNNSSNKGERK